MEVGPGQYQVSLDFNSFNNMYDLLYAKISDLRTSVNERGKMYSNFEQAVKYYNDRTQIIEDTEAYRDFSSLMCFVFLGRKEA